MTGKRVLRRVAAGARLLGIEPRQVQSNLRGAPLYVRNRRAFYSQSRGVETSFALGKPYPRLGDRYQQSGVASGQYFYQDLLVAQLIHEANPRRHVDVGSRIDGFVAHVASFRPIDVLDIRPLNSAATNIRFHQADLMQDVRAFESCTDSLSCLHALEHFGLGRYGDEVDPHGWRKGWENLARMLEPGGRLYFSVPLGRHQRVEFDAHRVFALPFIRKEMVAGTYMLEQFAYVDDDGALSRDVDVASPAAERSFDLNNGCGIFVLRKRDGPITRTG